MPEALAYASIAGVSPVVGLYAAPPALVLYAAFGSSRHLVVGPMSATAALSAAAVADLDHRRARRRPRLHRRAGDHDRRARPRRRAAAPRLPRQLHLRAGAQGLHHRPGADDHHRPGAQAARHREGGGRLLRAALGRARATSATPTARTLVVGADVARRRARPAALRAGRARRRWSPSIVGVVAVELFDLADKGVAIVGHDRQRAARRSGCPTGVGFADYLSAAGSAAGIMLVGFAEGLGAAKTYAARDHYEIDANRELLGLGAANLGVRAVQRAWSSTAACRRRRSTVGAGARSQVSGLVVAVLTVVTLLFLTGLFEDLPEATLAAVVIAAVDRARRHRRAAAASTALYTRRLGRDLRPRRPARLHRRRGGDARRADLRHAARAGHRHRRVAAAAAVPLVAGRTSPSSATSPGSAGPVRRPRPAPGERRGARRRRCCASRPGCSSPTPTPCGGPIKAHAAAPGVQGRRARRRGDRRSSTSPPCGCSTSWPTTSRATASSSSSPTTSARSATSSPRRTPTPSCRCSRRSTRPSPRSRAVTARPTPARPSRAVRYRGRTRRGPSNHGARP